MVGRADILTRSEVIARLTQRYKAKQAYGVVFAEEFIAAPTGQVIPPDLKFYTSYGSILQVLMRSVTRLRDESAVSMGYFSSEGTALGKVAQTDQFGADLALPLEWREALPLVTHLSKVLGLPFVRVDVYLSDRGPVLGELTPSPGGPQIYTRAHDREMGRRWVEARLGSRFVFLGVEGRLTRASGRCGVH